MIVIDQFRGDYLERYRDQFGDGGFRLLLDHGAYFPDCNYNYANTRTAPGHATLFTGAYSNGHGIVANEWWDQKKKAHGHLGRRRRHKAGGRQRRQSRRIAAQSAGRHAGRRTEAGDPGQVPRLRNLAERSRCRPSGGFAGDAAYWIDPKSGAWVTSTYYRNDLPEVGAGFQLNSPAEILGSRMERRAGNGSALDRASQG